MPLFKGKESEKQSIKIPKQANRKQKHLWGRKFSNSVTLTFAVSCISYGKTKAEVSSLFGTKEESCKAI
jgi:hypothetical protein